MARTYGCLVPKEAPQGKFLAAAKAPKAMPSNYDNFNHWPGAPIYNQGALNDCCANATAWVMQFTRMKQGLPNLGIPSRLFLYWNARKNWMEQNPVIDTGTYVRAVIVEAEGYGACFENGGNAWPYIEGNVNVQPPANCYKKGKTDAIKTENIIIPQTIDAFKTALSGGMPIAIGILVYSSFETDAVAKTGTVPFPNVENEQFLGGHAVTVTGYDDHTQLFKCVNSWGTGWGNKGRFTLPYKYLTDPTIIPALGSPLAYDAWTIQSIGTSNLT